MTTVLLIRHGRTSANATGVLAGRSPGVHLDATGRRQARTLARRLRDAPLTAVIHSPLERCRETAGTIVGERPELARHVDDRVTECDYGDWTGRALGELADDPLWAQVQDTPSEVTFPGGEALVTMAARAVAAITDWTARYPEGLVAVVSHGDVIKAILSAALAQPLDDFQRIVVGPGSLSVVQYGSHRPTVLRMNDTGPGLPLRFGAAQATVGGGAG